MEFFFSIRCSRHFASSKIAFNVIWKIQIDHRVHKFQLFTNYKSIDINKLKIFDPKSQEIIFLSYDLFILFLKYSKLNERFEQFVDELIFQWNENAYFLLFLNYSFCYSKLWLKTNWKNDIYLKLVQPFLSY